ncbi:threonine--tRNA ligase [Candidatus Woesearchaeota archaeon]|nr:threonine--tRNA ligase [Candidatus Woesearchaeota archaeon]
MTKEITLEFPDGLKKKYEEGITGEEIVKNISEGLARKTICYSINEELKDLYEPIRTNGTIKFLTFEDEEGQDVFRHSSAHLMAQAILRVFPEAKLTIGPVVKEGYYYDIDHAPFKQEDLEKIEQEMNKIVKENLPVKRKELTQEQAQELFKDNKYKLELLKGIGLDEENYKDKITVYEQGEFSDLCRGPHVPRTGMIKAFKITKIAGAYWRADAKNKQLQRLYGISFPEKKQLQEHLHLIEEAEKRDHRKIGKALDLYFFNDVSPGAAFFHPKGTIIYNELLTFLREEYKKRKYHEVITPLIYDKSLWETSGHWEHYKENMFLLNIDEREFSLKPMNCPSHLILFKNITRSYRDLPLKIADFAPLHRNELKGVLGGLTRVRRFSQDDAHIFCTKEQLQQEILDLLDFTEYIYKKIFKFEYKIKLSTKPEKAMGSSELWTEAERALKLALDHKNMIYEIKEGEGAFYGPKIDFDIKDALGRDWQCSTIQLDFQMPERFKATYEGEDGTKHYPIMVHRAILGSLERFIGVLIEHYAGKLPLWLSPVQVKVLTITDKQNIYADKIIEYLEQKGIRTEKDYKPETMGKKIRNAQLEQVKYIIVLGEKEQQNETINVRTRDGVIHGEAKLDKFTEQIIQEIKEKQ